MHSSNNVHISSGRDSSVPSSRHAGSARRVVGHTPLTWITAEAVPGRRGFWAKLEGFNPGGIKDRAGLHMVRAARRRGDLRPGAPIIESTSGTLGLGLTLAGISYGHPVALVGDPGLEPQLRRLLVSHGACLEIVRTPHPCGGWQEARRVRVRELTQQLPGAWCPEQYDNPDNVVAYAPLAAELIAELPWIDILVCAVGTGGHSAGIHRVLRQSFPGVRLVGVDTVGSTIFGQPARPRLMRGLGSSIYPRNVDYTAFSEVHWVNAAEAVSMCRRLALRSYHSGGWSTGAVALVADWLARTSPADDTIVAVFPDGPWRYCDTIYNDDYCREHDLLGHAPAPDPEELRDPGEREVICWTRCERVADPLATAPSGWSGP
jgi:S-sulfo-L-cysteine synthase (3-phospho-L-serine-dependent)